MSLAKATEQLKPALFKKPAEEDDSSVLKNVTSSLDLPVEMESELEQEPKSQVQLLKEIMPKQAVE